MKFTKGSAGTMTRHFERAKNKETGEYIKFGNQDIDTTKSYLNYDLNCTNDNQLEFIKNRLEASNVFCLNRKDINILCSWVVTAPKDLLETDQAQFFEESYKFLCNRYSAENCVSSYVHMDEITPHMHFAFIPIAWDEKKQRETVSAKKVLNRADLQSFHIDLENHMTNVFGRVIGVMNEATREGNKLIEELKRKSAQERLNEIQEITKNNIIASQKGLDEANKKAAEIVQNALSKAEKIDKVLNDAKAEQNALEKQIRAYKQTIGTFSEIEAIGKSTIFGKIMLTVEEAKRLKQQAKAYWTERSRAEKSEAEASQAKKQVNNIKKWAGYKENERLKEEIKELRGTIYDLKQSNKSMANSIEEVNEVFKRNSQLSKDFSRKRNELRQKQREQQQSYDLEM